MNTATIKGDSTHTGPPFFFISTMREGNYGHRTFYYVVGQLFLYPTIMSKAKKKKSKVIKSSQNPERVHAHVSTQTATDGWSLPVEPVICVAWKWKWVVAAEVIAGISILKGPNGPAYKNNTIRTEKQKERRKRRDAIMQR